MFGPWLTARPIAHRGLHDRASGRIENAPAAFRAAIERGFGIECDLQLSGDGEAMVFHDFVLDRLTGASGRVDAQPASALREITLAGSSGDRIPTFADLLALVAGRVPLVVEIKSRHDGDPALARRAAALAADYAGPLAFKSFDPGVVADLLACAPARPRGIVAMGAYEEKHFPGITPAQGHALANLLHFEVSRPDFLSWHCADLPSAAPFLCRTALGLPVMTWTVRDAAEARRVAAHADQIVFEGFDPSA